MAAAAGEVAVPGLPIRGGSVRSVARLRGTALVTDETPRAGLGTAARGRAIDFGLDRWFQWLMRLWIDLSLPVGRPLLVARDI